MGNCCPSYSKKKKIEDQIENNPIQTPKAYNSQNLSENNDSIYKSQNNIQNLNDPTKINNNNQIINIKENNINTTKNNNTNQNFSDQKNNDDLYFNYNPPIDIKKEYDASTYNFPRYTEYEKELNSNFKYFNVFWYDPNKTNDFVSYIKCFENVEFYKGDTLKSIIDFFKVNSISDWIVISPGFQGKEIISNLENFQCIKTFFIYCRNPNYHKWANNIKKVGCITSDPKILCEKLIEINKSYIMPNFNYSTKENKNIILLNNEKNNSKDIIEFKSSFVKEIIESKNILKKKLNVFYMKCLHYLNSNEIINDIKEAIKEGKIPFIRIIEIQQNIAIDDIIISSMISKFKHFFLLSFYFNNYPFLLNLFSYQEVINIINCRDELSDLMSESYSSSNYSVSDEISGKLYKKILNNESILDDEIHLKKIQISLLYEISVQIKISFGINAEFFNNYQIVNYLRDLGFCLILELLPIMMIITNKKSNLADEFFIYMSAFETRYKIYSYYLNCQALKVLSFNQNIFKENEDKIKDALTIKDFIVLGDIKFHEKIKTIEMYIKSKSFKYIKMGQISEYLNSKKMEERKKIITYFYFLIIKLEEFKKNFENIFILSMESGITFLVFIYIENKDIKKIPKNINSILPTILVYTPEDILHFLSNKSNFINPIDEVTQMFEIKLPKITFEQNDEDIYQNGCFELAETFDVNLIKNNLILGYLNDIHYTAEFPKNIYFIYKERNYLDLFYSQNCLYFGWNLYPELIISTNICFIKRFLYMYCREENPPEKSFYRIINDDLRSRDPNKIHRYINILALINKLIEEKTLASFNGYVYRATILDEKLIMRLVPGGKMVNTQFWSTSKDFKVTEEFLMNQVWRNSYIICKCIKNNIDIDSEKLNPYKEKEVLFLPYTEFIVDKVSTQFKYGKKIYIIELTELGNKNVVNIHNMKIYYLVSFGVSKLVENLSKNIKMG